MSKKTIALSGGFDPVHIGHIRMIQEATSLGYKVVILLNNDEWLIRKKGFFFQDFKSRAEILSHISGVHTVLCALDEDNTVLKSLELIKPDAFGNGGDRNDKTTPEREWCEANGVKSVFGLGGTDKPNSSSIIATRSIVGRKWGKYSLLYDSPNCKVKTLTIDEGDSISYQKHQHRAEHWFIISGSGHLCMDGQHSSVGEGDVVVVGEGRWHTIENNSHEPLVIVEVQHGEKVEESDITRLNNV